MIGKYKHAYNIQDLRDRSMSWIDLKEHEIEEENESQEQEMANIGDEEEKEEGRQKEQDNIPFGKYKDKIQKQFN